LKTYFLPLALLFLSLSASAVDFPLPDTNFVPAKMPMEIVYPRPDNETQNHSRHRWAHPSMPYEIPIGAQGGSWPFKYELMTGPTGATIGEYYGDANYGVLSWMPSATNGTETFNVKITDQELNVINATWVVTIDSSQFIFVQDGYGGTKLGTIDQPLESWEDWYKSDSDDNSFANKIIVFRGGAYSIVGDPADTGNAEINTGVKSPSIIGYPGELPVIDCSSAKIFTRGGANVRDIYVADIRWENGRQDVNNAHFFWATNKLTEIRNSGYNGSYVEAYGLSYWLVEENIVKNSDSNAGFFGKQTVSFATTRANEAFDNVNGEQIGFGYNTPTGMGVPHDHEVCWNRVRLPQNNKAVLGFQWSHNIAYLGQSYNSYIYRNTFVNGSSWVRFKGTENFETDGNVIVSNFSSRWDTSIMNSLIPNIVGNESAGITDQTGSLIGQYRLDYLGVAGHEVSGHEVSGVYVTQSKPVTSLSVN
jgi:hypothetical protein